MRQIRSSWWVLFLSFSPAPALAQNPADCLGADAGGQVICEPDFPGPWTWGACDEAAASCGRAATWCNIQGGTYCGCGCCNGGTPFDESNLVPRSITFANALHTSGGCHVTNDTGWGAQFYSPQCSGQVYDVYLEGWLTHTGRRVTIACNSGGETITMSKYRSLACPAGTTQRLLPYRGYVCVRPLEDCETCKNRGVGNPIAPGTGVKLDRSTDTPEGALLAFTRHYHSLGFNEPITPLTDSHTDNRVGDIWRGSFDTRVIPTTWGATAVTSANGDLQYFDGNGNELINYLRAPSKLVPAASGWFLNDLDGTKEYRSDGRLAATTSRTGQRVVLSYTFLPDAGSDGGTGAFAVDSSGSPTIVPALPNLPVRATDSSGRSLTFGYDLAGRLTTLTDWTGASTLYRYDSNMNLTSVTWPDGTTRVYRYNEPANLNGWTTATHALTSIIDENDAGFGSYRYDPSARAVSTLHGADAGRYTLSYGTDGGNVVTDPLGAARTFGFAQVGPLTRFTGSSTPGGEGYGVGLAKVEYDSAGNLTSRIDFLGRRTCLGYTGPQHQPTVIVEGLPQATVCSTVLNDGATLPAGSRRTVIDYHPRWGVPVRVSSPGLRTTSVFNGDLVQGSPVTCAPAGAVIADGTMAGQPIGVTCSEIVQGTNDGDGSQGFGAMLVGSPQRWAHTYDAEGRVLTVDSLRTDLMDVTTYTYYSTADPDVGKRGNLATEMDPLGHVTQYTEYEPTGRPRKIIDANGVTKTLTYDARQRLVGADVNGEHTSYAYDGVGNLVSITTPDGASQRFRYDDAHRLIQISDADNNLIGYALDAMGNRVGEWRYDSMGVLLQKHTRVYNALNRLVSDVGANGETTTYTYDSAGNLVSRTDALGHATQYAYDALDRRTVTTRPDLSTESLSYGARDEVTGFTDARGLTTQYVYSELGELLQTQSPDQGTVVNTFDSAGNVLTRTDAKGQKTTYDYDALNRVRHAVYADMTMTEWRYDEGTNGVGRLTTVVDPTGTTTYQYDALGRLLNETLQRKNAAGMLSFSTRYAYDAQGRLASMTYPSGHKLTYSYDGQGRVAHVGLETGNMMSTALADQVVHRPFGPVQSYNALGGTPSARAFDQNGLLSSFTLGGPTVMVGYDAAFRITTLGADTAGYDARDRLTTSGTESFTYDSNGNRLSHGGEVLSYAMGSNQLTQVGPDMLTWDSNGNLLSDGSRSFTYDARGRLRQVDVGRVSTQYGVDGLGRRVSKTVTTVSP